MDPTDAAEVQQNFFLNNPIPMWTYDLDTLAFLEVNRAAEQHYGYSRSEFLSMTIADIRPPDDLPALNENISRVTEGLDHAGTWRHVLKGGEIIYVEINSHTLTYEGRKAELVSAVDVTSLVEIEAAYARSEERYRVVSELTSDFAYAFRVDEDGTLTFEWSAGSLDDMTGYTTDDLASLGGWEHLIHDEDRAVPMRQLESLLAGRSETVEYRIVTSGGEVRWMRDTARPVWDNDQGRTKAIYGAIADITEQKVAREHAGRTLETLQTILDSIDATVYAADLESYEVLFANKRIKENFGEELVGKVCHRAFRAQDEPCELCPNPRLIDADGQPTELIVWEAQNPVNKRWYRNYDRAVRWPDNRLVRVQIATDITEIRNSEMNTRQLESQLQQTRRMEALGTLSGGIAHDFNNILSAIIGFTELALADVPARSPSLFTTFGLMSCAASSERMW